ncbi:MAG: M1 family aminopeptidase [Ginsengibacter sp.]
MMLTRLIFILLLFSSAYAQKNDYIEEVNSIVLNEMANRQRLMHSAIYNSPASADNFDVKYYRCEWEIDPALRFIKGKVTVYYVIVTSTNSISFDLMDPLIADSIKQRNIVLPKLQSSNILRVNFSGNIPPGTLDSITIFYNGIPPTTGFGSFIQSTHAGVPILWTLSEPYGSRDWWPCKNGLDDKADSIDIFLTHPSQYKAASNGLLQSETTSGTNTVTHWKHRYPIASYLVCFAVTNYTVFNNTVQLGDITLPMQTFCYPENLALFQANTPLVLDAMQLYNSMFGEYPFIKEKYGHVQFGWGGGQEHQTSTFIVRPDESLMAHELAHQWFGDKITCASWKDIWLNEGFATHLASIYMEKKYPAGISSARKNEIAEITSLPGGSVSVDDTTNVYRIFDGRLSYRKGSHLLYMLRWMLGDEIFFKGAQQYLSDPSIKYGFARTADLKRNLEDVSKKDLTKFFNDWVYGQGYPSYNVAWSQAGSDYVKIKMNQTTSHPSVSFFEMPVALEFKNATQQKTIVIDNRSNNEVFFKNIGFVADTVLIDPEYWLISKDNVSKKVTDNINGQNILQIFPNPAKNQLFVYLRNFVGVNATIGLYNSAGQLMYKKKISLYNNSCFKEIETTNYSSGIYFIKVQSGNKIIAAKKVVISAF